MPPVKPRRMRLLPSSAIRQFHQKSRDTQCKLLLQNIKVREECHGDQRLARGRQATGEVTGKGARDSLGCRTARHISADRNEGEKRRRSCPSAACKIWFLGWPYR